MLAHTSMTDDESTGEKPSDERSTECETSGATMSARWERVGREALSYQLEAFSTEVMEAFGEADRKVRNGEELTREDLSEMRQSMEMASHAVVLVEELIGPEAFGVDDVRGRHEE